MPAVADRHDAPTAIQSNLAAIFISLELSRSIWLVTSLSPGSAEKMSKHSVRAGDVAALLARFSELKRKASERTGKSFPIVVIQEAGLDGFWLHRVLQSEGVESHVVDPSSIATSRRRRRAKTDRIDGEALPEFWGEVQPPASLKGLDIPSRRADFVPWKSSRRRGFGMGNPTFR
jgi:transposase